MTRIIRSTVLILLFVVISCGRTEIRDGGIALYSSPEKYNVRVIAYDTDIRNPQDDRRCYYRLVFDKIIEARTTTGLESQEKTYEAKLSANKHLLLVEKWILDEAEGRYVKLNNVEQPKPNYFYFDIPDNRVVIITLNIDRTGRAIFTTDFERIR